MNESLWPELKLLNPALLAALPALLLESRAANYHIESLPRPAGTGAMLRLPWLALQIGVCKPVRFDHEPVSCQKKVEQI